MRIIELSPSHYRSFLSSSSSFVTHSRADGNVGMGGRMNSLERISSFPQPSSRNSPRSSPFRQPSFSAPSARLSPPPPPHSSPHAPRSRTNQLKNSPHSSSQVPHNTSQLGSLSQLINRKTDGLGVYSCFLVDIYGFVNWVKWCNSSVHHARFRLCVMGHSRETKKDG